MLAALRREGEWLGTALAGLQAGQHPAVRAAVDRVRHEFRRAVLRYARLFQRPSTTDEALDRAWEPIERFPERVPEILRRAGAFPPP